MDVVTCVEMAYTDPRLLMEMVAARQAVLQAVEAFFGAEAELYVEWSGLVRWRRGAGIEWHSDSGREYLRQREFSAVVYLNTQGGAFDGGTLRFAAGAPRAVAPAAGRLVAYSAGEADRHMVEPVARGARDALTVWFTRTPGHSEDAKVLQLLTPQPPLGLPSTLWQARPAATAGGGREAGASASAASGQRLGGAGSGEGGAAGAEEEAQRDVRVQRLAGLGLTVELPEGVDGRAALRPAAGGNAPATGHGAAVDGGADCHCCGSLQEASLLGHWAAAGRAEPRDEGTPARAVGGWTLRELRQAAAELAAEMAAAGEALEKALPIWRAHGFLVPPG